MTEGDIRKVLKKNNIGGVKGILRGRFEPFKVSKKNRQDMRDAGISNKFDNNAVINIQNQMRNLPLDPDDSPPLPVAPPSAPARNPYLSNPYLSNPQQDSSLQQPVTQPVQASIFPTFTQARAPGPVDPALLGDNPVTAALNAQIANRRG